MSTGELRKLRGKRVVNLATGETAKLLEVRRDYLVVFAGFTLDRGIQTMQCISWSRAARIQEVA